MMEPTIDTILAIVDGQLRNDSTALTLRAVIDRGLMYGNEIRPRDPLTDEQLAQVERWARERGVYWR